MLKHTAKSRCGCRNLVSWSAKLGVLRGMEMPRTTAPVLRSRVQLPHCPTTSRLNNEELEYDNLGVQIFRFAGPFVIHTKTNDVYNLRNEQIRTTNDKYSGATTRGDEGKCPLIY